MLGSIGTVPRLRGGLLAAVTACLVLAAPSPGLADHGAPSALSVPDLVHDLGARLDELAGSFGFEPRAEPDFDETRFNKLLRRARTSLEQARAHVERGQVCEGLFKLARSVSQLEHAARYGAAHDMSGWGFASDLASHASFIAESFLEELIEVAAREGADDDSLALAIESEATGGALRQDEAWTAALVEFVAGTCALL